MQPKILCVVGARPNFIKIAPLVDALRKHEALQPYLLHTGQHYDERLSNVFFEELGIPRPDCSLGVGSGSHAEQTAQIMKQFDPVLQQEQPQCVLVVGDVNSTVACTLVASKFHLHQPLPDGRTRPILAHVEAGLRSFDDDMPEEINRRVTDTLSDLCFVTDPAGLTNLEREGVDKTRVHLVGNVMIDTLLAAREKASRSTVLSTLSIKPKEYGLVTLHRPYNVDSAERLRELLGVLNEISTDMPLVFPAHLRTRPRIAECGVDLDDSRWRVIEPAGYLDFMRLLANAKLVLTDSGGVQEETTVLGVPCLTLRDNTERPITVDQGTNRLAGTNAASIRAAYAAHVAAPKQGRIPDLWDGRAAERIVAVLAERLGG